MNNFEFQELDSRVSVLTERVDRLRELIEGRLEASERKAAEMDKALTDLESYKSNTQGRLAAIGVVISLVTALVVAGATAFFTYLFERITSRP